MEDAAEVMRVSRLEWLDEVRKGMNNTAGGALTTVIL
jgi:hypothetical protein